jgi:hypothetical protein
MHDPAHHTSRIDPRYAMRQRDERRDPRYLHFAQQKQTAHQRLLYKDTESALS